MMRNRMKHTKTVLIWELIILPVFPGNLSYTARKGGGLDRHTRAETGKRK